MNNTILTQYKEDYTFPLVDVKDFDTTLFYLFDTRQGFTIGWEFNHKQNEIVRRVHSQKDYHWTYDKMFETTWRDVKVFDTLYEIWFAQYFDEFEKEIDIEELKSQGSEVEDYDDTFWTFYLGSMIWPSGKVYAFWTTNQTEKDTVQDEAWFEALEQFLSQHDMWWDHGEDPCDLFISWRNE